MGFLWAAKTPVGFLWAKETPKDFYFEPWVFKKRPTSRLACPGMTTQAPVRTFLMRQKTKMQHVATSTIETMPEAPPAQTRTSVAQSAMTITSMASAGIEDDDPFDQTQLTFEPEDPNYGQASSSAKHGPYYMHMGDSV